MVYGKENIDILVGGYLVKKYAMGYKIKTYELPISEDTMRTYVDMAKQLLKYTQNKDVKTEVIRNIEKIIDEYLNNNIKINNNILDKVSMNDVEKEKIIESLKKNSFSLSNIARDLKISRTTLWRKLKKYGIKIV